MDTSINFCDKSLETIFQKILNGTRLTLEDGIQLYSTNDLISLGKMAHFVQQKKNGDNVYFVVNQKIEPTNICVLSCKFCDFATKKGRSNAYEMTIEEILSKLSNELHEVHITGGMPSDWEWERYLNILKEIKSHFPKIDIKAFTAVEIDFFHKKFKLSVEEILRQLYELGLRSLPGGGAEVFSERIRRLLFNQKIGEKRWLEIHRIAHQMGIKSNCTLLYGHIETIEERVNHMIKLRSLQDETNGFLSFIPLAFQPGNTGIKTKNEFTSAIDDLKTIAISRLMLDNIPHIKAYWVMLTEEVASISLNFGADDIDGTVGGEKIAHDAGAISPMQITKSHLIKIIREAKKIPVERDIYYNPIDIYSENIIGKIPYLNATPFYNFLEKENFKILSTSPFNLGKFSKENKIDAGLFSLVNFFEQEQELELLDGCIATRDQVKSVILFSNYVWKDLEHKTIGITDETATSVQLLKILLEKKYRIKANFEVIKNTKKFDAILLIGDKALQFKNKNNFHLTFDLASEWYDWQKLPFVFAVLAMKKNMPLEKKNSLRKILQTSLEKGKDNLESVGLFHGEKTGLSKNEIVEYLQGFNYHLGEREKEAIKVFKAFMIKQVEV